MLLDKLTDYKKYDVKKIAGTIELLADQVRQVLEEARLIKIPKDYNKMNKVVVNGMGGSNLGAGIVKAVLSDRLGVPISITPGYEVPAYVNDKTLYILSSYSGNTEEPLSVYREVKKRGAKILAITMEAKSSRLAKLMIKDNIPGYFFQPNFNPSFLPRLGNGYMIFGTMVLLAKSGLFKIEVKEIENLIASLEIWDRGFRPAVKTIRNPAKQLAQKLFDKIIVLVGAEFLTGNLRVLRNQFCETSKNSAFYLILPDMNHFALESLAYPKANRQNLIYVFFNSELYHPRVGRRLSLTEQIIEKHKIKIVEHNLAGETKLEQAFAMLQFGSWVSYYLAMLNQVEPAENPWVDWFKKQLK